jgi:hypothetical protein
MGTLARKARSLELSRGLGGAAAPSVAGLVWTAAVAVVDRARLADGELVVCDYTILDCGALASAEGRERVTRDADDVGVVYAYDGRAIGRVIVGRRGGVVLDYVWPGDLPAARPEAAPGSGSGFAGDVGSPP